jgi:hypothetical protein
MPQRLKRIDWVFTDGLKSLRENSKKQASEHEEAALRG